MSSREKRSGVGKWIACGCIGCAALIIAVIVGIVGLGLGGAFLGMKSNDAYRGAVDRASVHPQVIAAVGEPVEAGFFVSGSVNVSGPSGDAELSIPISGPKGKATLYLVAEKTAGLWEYSTLEVAVKETGERIDLLDTPVERVY